MGDFLLGTVRPIGKSTLGPAYVYVIKATTVAPYSFNSGYRRGPELEGYEQVFRYGPRYTPYFIEVCCVVPAIRWTPCCDVDRMRGPLICEPRPSRPTREPPLFLPGIRLTPRGLMPVPAQRHIKPAIHDP